MHIFLPPCHVQSFVAEQNGSFPQPQNGSGPQKAFDFLNLEGQIFGLFARSLALQPSRDLGWQGRPFEKKTGAPGVGLLLFFFWRGYK